MREIFDEFFDRGNVGRRDVSAFLANLPRHRFGGYGGNTPCIEVGSREQQVILDAGSGLRQLGYEMLAGPCGKGEGEVHLFFTHFHWDHLAGLPFFTPIFIPGNIVHVYSVQPDLEDVFRTIFKKPYFPVPLEKLGARIVYHRLEPRQALKLKDISITPYQLDHPDPCWGYRVECRGKVFTHAVDTECTRVSVAELGPDLPLYQGVDLMIFDAQYTLLESMEKVNWGHASASVGLDLALREGVKRVLFMHHDPASTDAKVAAAEAQARAYYLSLIRSAERNGEKVPHLEWGFVHEGLTAYL